MNLIIKTILALVFCFGAPSVQPKKRFLKKHLKNTYAFKPGKTFLYGMNILVIGEA